LASTSGRRASGNQPAGRHGTVDAFAQAPCPPRSFQHPERDPQRSRCVEPRRFAGLLVDFVEQTEDRLVQTAVPPSTDRRVSALKSSASNETSCAHLWWLPSTPCSSTTGGPEPART